MYIGDAEALTRWTADHAYRTKGTAIEVIKVLSMELPNISAKRWFVCSIVIERPDCLTVDVERKSCMEADIFEAPI